MKFVFMETESLEHHHQVALAIEHSSNHNLKSQKSTSALFHKVTSSKTTFFIKISHKSNSHSEFIELSVKNQSP
jgi:hypothetical protein